MIQRTEAVTSHSASLVQCSTVPFGWGQLHSNLVTSRQALRFSRIQHYKICPLDLHVTQIWHLWSLQPVDHSSEMICLSLKLSVDIRYRNSQLFLLYVHCCVVCRPTIENTCISVVHNRVHKTCNVAVNGNESCTSVNESFSTAVPKLANWDHHKPVPYYNWDHHKPVPYYNWDHHKNQYLTTIEITINQHLTTIEIIINQHLTTIEITINQYLTTI